MKNLKNLLFKRKSVELNNEDVQVPEQITSPTLQEQPVYLKNQRSSLRRSLKLTSPRSSSTTTFEITSEESVRLSGQFKIFDSFFVKRSSLKITQDSPTPDRGSQRKSLLQRNSEILVNNIRKLGDLLQDESHVDEDFTLTNYTIDHQTIFEYKDIGDAFYEFLKIEINPEPWEFLQSVEKYEKLKSTKDKIKCMKEIVMTHISDKSPKLVNISGVTKRKLLNSLQPQLNEEKDTKWLLNVDIDSIFEETKKIVRSEMIVDVFPRFIRSINCLHVLSRYKNNPKVLLPVIALKGSYTNEFVKGNIILDSHIEYFKKAAEDSFDYDLLSTKTINTFIGTNNYIPKVSLVDDITVYKYEGIVNYPLEHVICSLTLLRNRLKYDNDCLAVDEIEYLGYEKYNQLIQEECEVSLINKRGVAIVEMDYLYPGDSRYMKQSSAHTVTYNKQGDDEEYLFFSRPIESRKLQSNEEFDWKKPVEITMGDGKKRKHYLSFGIVLQSFKKIDDEKTFLRYFHVLSFNTKKTLTKKEKRSRIGNRSKHLMPSILSTLKSTYELNDEFLTLENYEQHLKTDSVGKLILETKK
eukprot:gene3570-6305_t